MSNNHRSSATAEKDFRQGKGLWRLALWSILHKMVLQPVPDERKNFLCCGFWHDERWFLDYETECFNPACPLPISYTKVLFHFIRFDSLSVSSCLLWMRWRWQDGGLGQHQWKMECQTLNLMRGVDAEVTDSERTGLFERKAEWL